MSSTLPPVTALTFDLDDTLWDNHEVMVATENGHYAWLDEALARADTDRQRLSERFPLSAYQARRQHIARREPLRRGDFTWIRRQSLIEMLHDYGLPHAVAEEYALAAMEHFMTLRHRLTPYPEVEGLLDALAQRYALAAITNGNVQVTRLPLARHFPVAIAAGELLAPKPDARPFLAALARLGSAPSRAMHVGDSWHEDVLPAWRLGMRVAWIDKHDERPSELPAGVYRLAHVRELPALLEHLT
ncbi:putative hydrolase of the HAD superfamily [Modicisalibacter ilicicola DSM 19980]|uniref:Putative hydrolase of the HAD superfamily n=1 Tax=Modicisalibacter ilicicola DSM 19980 TaxID=1121942 RepID=A0A1M5AI87_9GAMM|nr:HAD family hydrolase [Halomonas ilicicola]SHF29923.1 putative hydrolase of the HAD superfamily [Halomonas ilicicola DSM 19980]